MANEYIGKVIDGRYRLDEELGSGAVGTVYRALQIAVDRIVAVKLLHNSDDETFNARFEQEAKAIAKLNHTNILTLFDFGYDDELKTHYMVTEFVEGQTLAARMMEMMSTELILKVGLEIANALHHAHGHGILHRDLKPENIVLTRADGRVDVAKVLDFGLAHLIDPRSAEDQPDEPEPVPPESFDEEPETAIMSAPVVDSQQGEA